MAIIVRATVARAWPIMRTSFPHVVDACKYMLYLGACACNAPVAPLLPLSQWFARLPFTLDMLSVTHHPEHLAAIAAGVAPVSEHVPTCVVPAEHFIKVRAVVLVGDAGHHLADEFVARVHADAELVAVVALAVLFVWVASRSFCLHLAALQSAGVQPCSSCTLSSFVKCWMGAFTSVASMIWPQQAR